jgi:hypothetical protein
MTENQKHILPVLWLHKNRIFHAKLSLASQKSPTTKVYYTPHKISPLVHYLSQKNPIKILTP